MAIVKLGETYPAAWKGTEESMMASENQNTSLWAVFYCVFVCIPVKNAVFIDEMVQRKVLCAELHE